jgi:DNA invertase Pin-like site-specific DNA recombinase
MNMKRCVIYCRQSAGSEDFSESVEAQKTKCEELARKEGYAIEGIFEDLNTSGKTYPTGSEDIAKMDLAFQNWFNEQTGRKMYRPGFGAAIKAILSGNIDVIICYDITRLYRPISGSYLESHINQILILKGVKILTVNNGVIDVGNFNDSLITALQNRINHEQISIQRQKSKDALHNLKNNGEYQAGLWKKFGFQKGVRTREIEINEEEAKIVKAGFKLFYEGNSVHHCVKIVNEMRKNINGRSALFNRCTFKRMLMSPIYCGYIYSDDGQLIKSKQTDGIVDFSMWKEVNEMLKLNRGHQQRKRKNWNPFAWKNRCKHCGRSLTIHTSRRVPAYICTKHSIDHSHEPCVVNLSVTRDIKYGLGLVDFVYPLLSITALKELELSQHLDTVKRDLDAYKIELHNIIEREKKLTGLFVKGLMDEETLNENLKELTTQKVEVNSKIIELENVYNSSGNSVEKQLDLLRRIAAKELDKGEYEVLVRKTINYLHIGRDDVKIDTIYGDFTIARQKLSKYNLLPHYMMNMDREYNVNIIYYYGVETNLPELNNKRELVAEWNKIKIWVIKNS